MNFFEAQAKAKRHTLIFITLFIIAIAGLTVLTNMTLLIAWTAFETQSLTLAVQTFMQKATYDMWFISAGLVVIIVGSGSLYMILELSKGGSVVAVALGGAKINPHTQDAKHKQLLNVVEEMAIASGIPVPPVYVLKDQSINAFAAGHSADDVVIGVTQGLLEYLSRDELQGVIAHEFSHIFNGDMKINMRLTGFLHGIVLVGLIGEMILRALMEGSHRTRSSRSSGKKEGGGIVVIVIAVAVAFYLIGIVGKLVGGVLKAMISRKREYLADATAVQYTRYPQGIASALKKIGGLQSGSVIDAPAASTYSHLYFSNGVSSFLDTLFATHPPLAKRIKAIEPGWNGTYPKVQRQQTHSKPQTQTDGRSQKEKMATVLAATIGTMATQKDLQHALRFKAELSKELSDMAYDALGAQALILALLSDQDTTLYKRQLTVVSQQLLIELSQAVRAIKKLERKNYLELIQLCMPALKSCSTQQYRTFKSYVEHFVKVDKKITLFEWSLQHIVLRPLDRHFGQTSEIKMIHATIGAIRFEAEILFSMLVQSQYEDETEAKQAFDRVKKAVTLPVLTYQPKQQISFEAFTQAIAVLQTAKLPIKKRVLESAVALMHTDEKLTIVEYEMIHALALILQIPLPPTAKSR